MAHLAVLPVAVDVPLGQALIKIRKAEQPALCPGVPHLVCLGARLRGAIAPVLRIELAEHLMPYTFPIRVDVGKRTFLYARFRAAISICGSKNLNGVAMSRRTRKWVRPPGLGSNLATIIAAHAARSAPAMRRAVKNSCAAVRCR